MTDERLQQLLDEAATSYRVPKDPPLDAMWARIERESFDAHSRADGSGDVADDTRGRHAASAPWRRWSAPAVGIAATLLVGIGIGRFTATSMSTDPFAEGTLPVATVEMPVPDPLQRTTYDYLDDAEVLLASLPRSAAAMDEQFIAEARQLLTTTRMLLDSPVGADPRMRDVLEDLELVLAQMARLRGAPRAEELTFIAAAMDERDVVPRLRNAAASLTPSDY